MENKPVVRGVSAYLVLEIQVASGEILYADRSDCGKSLSPYLHVKHHA
jgi:hypothetical protein